jgi:hypothetical protein
MNLQIRGHHNLFEFREATFSPCMAYRYTLRIAWDESKPFIQFIGLNPSTADEIKDDNTVRRCKRFAQRWKFGGMIMTNIFAFRSTDPRPMKAHSNPIGEAGTFTLGRQRLTNRNDYYLALTRTQVTQCVAAWGNHGLHLNRCFAVAKLLSSLKCFRITKAGQPEHPLYMPYNVRLMDYASDRPSNHHRQTSSVINQNKCPQYNENNGRDYFCQQRLY